MQKNLIMDVGMLNGEDSEFYLAKGFNVVAVEADPVLVQQNRKKFVNEINSGRLTLVPYAITGYTGFTTFYVNKIAPEWGTLASHLVERNAIRNLPNTPVEVECIQFEQVLSKYGIPYYLKIDIEGADMLCIQALEKYNHLPKYVSIEIDDRNLDFAIEPLKSLYKLGYRQFKLVDQSLNRSYRCPSPPLEGDYVDAQFSSAMSGPFGEESPNDWQTQEAVTRQLKRFILNQNIMLPERKRYKFFPLRWVLGWWRKLRGYNNHSWYDLHAKLDNETTP